MQVFKKYIAVLLLLISTLFVVPKELLHELAFHHDTADTHCAPADGEAIDVVHHHCDILQLFVQPYDAVVASVLFSNSAKIISHYNFISLSFSAEVVRQFIIRGPPYRV